MTKEEILAQQQAAQAAQEAAAQQQQAADEKAAQQARGPAIGNPGSTVTPTNVIQPTGMPAIGNPGSTVTPTNVIQPTGMPAVGNPGTVVAPAGVIQPTGRPAVGYSVTGKGDAGKFTPKSTTTAPITTTESNLQPQATTTQTPYGPVTVTRPEGAPAVPNALARERTLLDAASTDTMPKVPAVRGKTVEGLQQTLEASAQNYRDLVAANAPPDVRAAARQQYSDALESKALLARQIGGAPPGRSRPMPETGAKRMAEIFQTGAWNPLNSRITGLSDQQRNDAEQARIAHYNKVATSMGVNPYQIGTAEMNAEGGLNVMPIREETAINTLADKAAKQYRDLQRIEHDARQAYKEVTQQGKKGKRAEGQTAAEEIAKTRLMEAQQATEEYGMKSGAVDPSNPTTGANIDNIRRTVTAARALGRDPSSLSGLAQEQVAQKATGQKKKAEEPKKEPTQADRQAQEMAEITARNQAANEEWYRELERRKRMMLGQDQGQYAYNY